MGAWPAIEVSAHGIMNGDGGTRTILYLCWWELKTNLTGIRFC